MKKTILILIILLTLTFGVRLFVAFNTYIISSDGPFYISVAKDFSAGNYKEALTKQTFHPFYPFLIALASKFINSWEWAGMLVSIILSSLGIIPLYFMARKYFSDAIAIMACLLYCFHPQGAQLSASIFTTGTFIGVFLFALWITIIALEKNNNLYFTLSGLLSFIIYLVRPDGIIFLLLSVIAILINKQIIQDKTKHTTLKIMAVIIPWILLLPYLFAVESLTGVFGLTGKVSAETLTEMEIAKSFNGVYQFVVDFIKGANPLLFILFLVGLVLYFKKERKPLHQPLFIWLVFAGFIIAFSIYAFIYGRMSKRYTVPLFLMMLPWTSAGLSYVGEKISSRFTSKVVCGITILLLLFLSFFTFKPVGKDKLIEKTTGELLKKYHAFRSDTENKPTLIITMISRIAYYANGTNILPDGWDKDNQNMGDIMRSLKDTVRQNGVDYLVLDGRITRKFPDLEKKMVGLLNGDIKVELISSYFDGASGNYYKTYQFVILPH